MATLKWVRSWLVVTAMVTSYPAIAQYDEYYDPPPPADPMYDSYQDEYYEPPAYPSPGRLGDSNTGKDGDGGFRSGPKKKVEFKLVKKKKKADS